MIITFKNAESDHFRLTSHWDHAPLRLMCRLKRLLLDMGKEGIYASSMQAEVNGWCLDEHGPEAISLSDADGGLLQAITADRGGGGYLESGAARRDMCFRPSRSQDQLFPREGKLTQIKNPDAFSKIPEQHRERFIG